MSLDQILNLFALVVVNVCGYAALAPRIKRVEDKLDAKANAADVKQIRVEIAEYTANQSRRCAEHGNRIAALERSA